METHERFLLGLGKRMLGMMILLVIACGIATLCGTEILSAVFMGGAIVCLLVFISINNCLTRHEIWRADRLADGAWLCENAPDDERVQTHIEMALATDFHDAALMVSGALRKVIEKEMADDEFIR